nr:MAG TPA: hypothetical protein [Crassvirales sp.]
MLCIKRYNLLSLKEIVSTPSYNRLGSVLPTTHYWASGFLSQLILCIISLIPN